jgi:branched-subunit amino acid aminotransferase/4-amino-4-deoxychorismate lyase
MADHNHGDDFHIFTTFRVDGALLSDAAHTSLCGGHESDIYLLPFHFDRLKTAAATVSGFQCPEAMMDLESFGQRIQDAIGLSNGEESLEQSGSHADVRQAVVRRGKVSWWPTGRLDITLVPVPRTFSSLLPTSLDAFPVCTTWTAVLDDRPTEPDLYTEIKTSRRIAYDRARKSAGLDMTSTEEVLLYNLNGEIIDGSITTVYFYRDNKWVTPQCRGLEGTTRRFALETELCSLADSAVRTDSLRDGETIWLSNAFRGFYAATFRTR